MVFPTNSEWIWFQIYSLLTEWISDKPNICISSLNQDISFIHQELRVPTIEVDSEGLKRAGIDCEDISTSPDPGEAWPSSAGVQGREARTPSRRCRAARLGGLHLTCCLSTGLATPPLPPLLPSGVVAWRCTCFYGSLPKCQSHGEECAIGWALVHVRILRAGQWGAGTSAPPASALFWGQGPHKGELHQDMKGILRMESSRRGRRGRGEGERPRGRNFDFVNH